VKYVSDCLRCTWVVMSFCKILYLVPFCFSRS